MAPLGRAGDVGFNRARRDGTRQVWGGLTEEQNHVSDLVQEVLNTPTYNSNTSAANRRRIYGPQSIRDILGALREHNNMEYAALQKAKLDRPLLWARDSAGRACTYETRPTVLSWPAANAEEAKEACRYYPHQPNIIMKVRFVTSRCIVGFASDRTDVAQTVMNFADDFEPKRVNSQAAMFRAMGVKEIAENILARMPFWSRAQLSRTCSDATLVTSDFQTMYDLTRKDLQYSDYTEEEFAKMKQEGAIPDSLEQRGTKVRVLHLWR